jgi:formylmethanofuran dehydrogenase subunit B
MAVAWIGNRETLVERAAEHAARLLESSRCPVFSFDTDIHGTRAAIALAEKVGGAYDHVEAAALARETEFFTGRGGMTVAPGEVRRRADVVAIVGGLPAVHHDLVRELARTAPDLSTAEARHFFLIGDSKPGASGLPAASKATRLSCEQAGLAATLAALRAAVAGRQVAKPVSNFQRFAKALETARFPVFLFSGHGADGLALEMLQGLVADLNRKSRASSLHLPASESGLGSSLASAWMTGFPMRCGFARGVPEFDPWRFDVARMLGAGEADLHVRIAVSADLLPPRRSGTRLVALVKTATPVGGAAITIAVGAPGVDHDSVAYCTRTGTLRAAAATATSEMPSAALALGMIASHLGGVRTPC